MFGKKKLLNATQNLKTDIIDASSPFAFIEGYKSLRTNLSFMTFGNEVKTILVTSTIPGEGKSSISLNLARTLSMSGKKVLLIDGDMRAPSLHRYLRIRKKVNDGFSSVLAGKSVLEDAIYLLPPLEIDVMLSGPIPPNASELLSRDIARDTLSALKNKYDYVIIDTPPVGVVTDAAILAHFADGVLFVVRQNYADRKVVKNAVKNLEASGVKILGAVLNDYSSAKDVNSSSNYEYQYSYDAGESDD